MATSKQQFSLVFKCYFQLSSDRLTITIHVSLMNNEVSILPPEIIIVQNEIDTCTETNTFEQYLFTSKPY